MILILMTVFFLSGCAGRQYHQVEVQNPVYTPNTAFRSYEDLKAPGFNHLIEKYQLDTVFHGETDEFKRILLLRHWIRSVVQIDNSQQDNYGKGNPEVILDSALCGVGFHCGHYMRVQNAIMNAYGYVTRTLGAGPGVKDGPNGHHGINEIWVNEYHKWFLSDAKYDHHFEKNGIPLSAIEIRDEYLKNKAADIVMVNGPDRVPVEFDTLYQVSKERFSQTYTWIEWDQYNDIFSAGSKHTYMLMMYQDDYFRNHTWYWGNGPHWAYKKPEILVLEPNRNAFEWTPGVIQSKVEIKGNVALVYLNSETPNLREYQKMKLPGGNWVKTGNELKLPLRKVKNEWLFRTVNLAGVTGPENKIIIESD